MGALQGITTNQNNAMNPGNNPIIGTTVGSALGGPVGGLAGSVYGAKNYHERNGLLGGIGGGGTPISGLTGTAGGISGTGFAAPQTVPLQAPISPEMSANSIQAQQRLLAALQAQGGLTAQTNAMNNQRSMAAELAGGAGNLQSTYGNMGNVAGQYQNLARGTGPNPAQAMLNQQTGRNVANQAALMAGQRGAGANVGLIARQAGQQGAATQQEAVGQGATLQAQQQLSGLQGMQGAYQAQADIANRQLAGQQAANQAYQTQANQIAGQQIGATQQQQAQMLGGGYQQNANALAQQQAINTINANLAQTQMQGQQGIVGGVMQGAGAIASMFMAEGGEPVQQPVTPAVAQPAQVNGPSSSFGQFLKSYRENAQILGNQSQMSQPQSGPEELRKGAASMTEGFGGMLKNMMYQGGSTHDYRGGGPVKARNASEKASVAGNSYSNDKIKAVLSDKEIVIPRSITMSADPVRGAADFVAKVIAKRGKK